MLAPLALSGGDVRSEERLGDGCAVGRTVGMIDDRAVAMKELHDKHSAPLLAFCLQLTSGDRARAEDVSQETMLRTWRNLPSVSESRGSVRAWLFTVARNVVIDEWRTRRAQLEFATADLPEMGIARDHTDDVLLSWVVAESLTSLSADHRAVLVECYFRDRSVAQAARLLGIPEGTVKSRAHYALRSLRTLLEERGVTR
jgi:RNA polymerase sigma-70 factor (ECF subfamily)